MPYDSLHDRLRGPVATALKKDLKIENALALPRIEKVVVSVGINKSKMDSKEMHAYVIESLGKITGQKPVFTKARKAISNFKTREGMTVGAMVTLRGKNAEEFLDRLISYALPRIRDFRGLTTKLDGNGNYSIGIPDHSIFPEVPPADAKQIFGLQVQIKTTGDDDEQARALLKQMGVPFRPEKKKEEKEKEEKEAREKQAAKEALAEAAPPKEEEKSEEKPEEESVEPKAESEDTSTSES